MDCTPTRPAIDRFIRLVGRESWQSRIDQIIAAQPLVGSPTLCGRDVLRRHSIEVAIERQRRPGATVTTESDRRILDLAAAAVSLHASLSGEGRARLEERLAHAMLDGQSLMPLFHLLRTAWLHRSRGFEVTFGGLSSGAPYDIRLVRNGDGAEVACDIVSAEHGRGVHRGAWSRLVDTVTPELTFWLAAHPGRYLLKMTLPGGLRLEGGVAGLERLRDRIRALLAERRRADIDADAVIRLDPLTFTTREAGTKPVLDHLTAQFGPDTQLAVFEGSRGSMFALAAHAGRENDLPAALARRMSEVAPERLTGELPGILAMFIDDTELAEWRRLRAEMRLEAETRQFLTTREARNVVSVACTSRHELFDRNRADGEFRFRNPRHVAAKLDSLAPSILSSN